MPTVRFSHPTIDKKMGGHLAITTGANEITWGYGLNTQSYPTFGGEVVQILSAYTDDLVVQGDARSYADMEFIHEWFLNYIQEATQGGDPTDGFTSFNQTPIQFAYPERGWHQNIIVTELPSFRYGRDVVIPQYRIKAHVVEQHPRLNDAIVDKARSGTIDLSQFGRVTAGIGFVENNPFSDPFPKLDASEIDAKTSELLKQVGDYYTSFIPSYMSGDFKNKLADYGAAPAFLAGGDGSKRSAKNIVGERVQKNG